MKTWKGIALLMCLALAMGLVLAGEGHEKGKSHKEKAEIVSVDVENKIIVIKDEKGEEHKAPVMGKALETLKTWKAGDKVIVVCQDDEKGEHLGVVAIMKADASKT